MTAAAAPGPQRTPARRKAQQLAKHLRAERPDYAYLKDVFRHLREELGVEVTRAPKKLPYIPTEAEIRAFYDAVWKARRASDVILIKTLLYTGVRVSELVQMRIADVDLDTCRIRITQGKGGKDRVVPFPAAFKETLALHIDAQRRAGAVFLFESSWKKPYTAASARSSPGTPRPRASPPRSARTPSATSCSHGSRPRASTTRSSSPTAATPPASPWRSTPASPWPTPSSATTTSSATSPSDSTITLVWAW